MIQEIPPSFPLCYSMSFLFSLHRVVLASAVLFGLSLANQAHADSFTVSNTNDSGAGSLRQAILDANGNANPTVEDVITFDSGVTGTINLTTVGDTATGASAFILQEKVKIVGPGASQLTVQRDASVTTLRIFYVPSGATATISGLSIKNGVGGNGGGINNSGTLTLQNCTLSGHQGTSGGAIRNSGGTLLVQNCTLSGNNASSFGGGIRIGSGTVDMQNSTIAGNTCTNSNTGGGIDNSGTLTLSNSTIVGNSVTSASASNGGGLWLAGAATITNCTITGNSSAGTSGASGIYGAGGAITVSNTIVAGGTNNTTQPDVTGGSFTSSGYNLIGSADAATGFVNGTGGDIVGTTANPVAPFLGSLADNGGPTQTIALQSGSPAIDAGNSTTPDQRDASRPFDVAAITNAANGSDIGAVEQGADAPQIGPNFVVNQTTDHDDGLCGTTDCTLREAINAANSNGDPTVTDVITFANSVRGTIDLAIIGDTSNSNSAFILKEKVDVQGPGANLLILNRSTGGNYRHFYVPSGATATISGLTLANGNISVEGGAIYNRSVLNLSGCTFTNNMGSYGGAISNHGLLIATGCTFTGNSASSGGGGAVYANTASYSSGPLPATYTQISNSTMVGNTTVFRGGGIYDLFGLVIVDSCTIASNTAPNGNGGGIFSYGDSTAHVRIRNSIVVGNLQTGGGDGTDVDSQQSVPYDSQGYNLIGDGKNTGDFTATGDMTGATLASSGLQSSNGKAQLADNGGPTQTVALLPASPAVGTGSTDLTTDQRGLPRPFGDADDKGAFELQQRVSQLSITKTDNTPTFHPGDTLTYKIVVSNAGPDAVTGASVTDILPAGLTGVSYTGAGTGGGTGTAAGAGSINDTVALPVGATFTYTVTATVKANTTSSLANTATVTASNGTTDPTPGDNTATDIDVLSNTAPSISSVTITPTAPKAGQDLTAHVSASDAENDPITYSYVWKKGANVISGQTGPTLPASQISDGDSVTVTVTANDGFADSVPVTSDPVTVGNVAPTVDSVSPQGASDAVGAKRTFTLTMSDANGAKDIREMWLLINTQLDWSAGATLIYRPSASSPTNGQLFLRRGDDFLPPITIGTGASSSDVLDNGAVRVVATDVSVSASGNSITLTLPLTIRDGLVGSNLLFARAQDSDGATDPASLTGEFGFVREGSYTVTPQFTGGINSAPTLSKLTPGATYTTLNGSGVAPSVQTFGFFAQDTNGIGDIESLWFLAGPILDWGHSATFVYYPRTRRLVLRSDDGNSFLGGGQIGTAGIIENSQVRVDLSKVKLNIYSDGKTLGLSLPLQAKSGLLGANKVWLRVQDNSGATSPGSDNLGFVQSGTWSVKAATLEDPKPSNGQS